MLRSAWLAICLLLPLLLGSCRPPPLMSYPYFWDYTTTKPNDMDVAGSYKVLKVRLPTELAHSVQEKESTIRLKADHTVAFVDVPGFDDFGEKLVCRMSGFAKWKLDKQISPDWGWSVGFQDFYPASKPVARACDPGNSTWGILVLSRHAPYRLYTIVGDPDSDTGIEYRRVAP